MPVQLILYPQHNDGFTYITTNVFNEYVADGSFANGIDSVAGTTSSLPSQAVLTSVTSISAWRGWNTTGGSFASVSAPSISTAGLTLDGASGGTEGSTGVHQLIGGLTIGFSYEITLNITTFSSGLLWIGNFWNNNWTIGGTTYNNLGSQSGVSFTPTSVSGGKITHTFSAMGSPDNEVFVLEYQGISNDNLVISSISIKETTQSATNVYTDLSDGQVICDLYEDESIPLSLSIDDFKNIAEKVQSYSKDFHLPNTKRNNKIFGHIFEVARVTDGFAFNPYIKSKAILKEDGYTLFEGFLQLIDIKDKESEISYNVNLYSEPVTLKDILDNKTFADIDFTELQHDYTITNIKNSWVDATGLTLESALATDSFALESGLANTKTNVLKYPFVNWRGDWSINSLGNIELIDLEQVFRPFIQIKYLVKRIINEAGFEFSSDFFDTANFKKLFMDFNWGQGLGSSDTFESFETNNNEETIIYAATSFTELEVGTMVSENPTGISGTYLSNNTFTSVHANTKIEVSYKFFLWNNYAGTRTVNVEWQRTGSITSPIDQDTKAVLAGYLSVWSGSFNYTMQNVGDTLKPVFKADIADKVFQANGDTLSIFGATKKTKPSEIDFSLTSLQVASTSLLHAIRGDINQWEFLKGIFTMFNLVVLKKEETLVIEPYADTFITNSDSTQHNWTDKVDISEIKLKPIELKKKVIFTYAEDNNDYPLNVYKKATSGYLYGTKELNGSTAVGSQISNLTGEDEVIATPFAPTLLRPATDLFDATLTIPHIYSGNEDGTEFEDFENAPRILYNLGVKTLGTNTYFIPEQNGVGEITLEKDFLQFGHLTDIPTIVSTPPVATDTVDYNFGECQLIQPIGTPPVDNLFNTYHSPYYDELYHPDTRVMTMKVNLTPADIQNFKFYDTCIIKNREYRVNKIEYKPNTLAKVEFILIS